MPRYSINQPIRLFATTSQIGPTGAYTPTNAGTLTLTIRRPDLSTVTYSTPTNTGTGTYYQDVPVSDLYGTGNLLGRYYYTWVATGTAAGEQIGNFDLFDPFEATILSLQDAKAMLRIPQTNTASDTELATWIATVESAMEGFTGGPIINRTVNERVVVTRAFTAMALRQRPLVSVTAITPVSTGVPLTITDMELDLPAGIIHRKLGWPFYGPYFVWLPVFTVTYVAGWGLAVPPALESAARIIVKNLWLSERGGTPSPMQGEETLVSTPGMPFAIPQRALELMQGSYPNVNGDLMPFEAEADI